MRSSRSPRFPPGGITTPARLEQLFLARILDEASDERIREYDRIVGVVPLPEWVHPECGAEPFSDAELDAAHQRLVARGGKREGET